MGSLLLVAPADAEVAALSGVPGCRVVPAEELARALASEPTVDVVVIGSAAGGAVALAQLVHREAPTAEVVVVADPVREDDLRRAVSYAPGVPLGMRLVNSADDSLPAEVEEARRDAETAHRHRALLAAVSSRPHDPGTAGSTRRPVAGAMGALLDHAPIGVLVCDPSGSVLAWNRRAGELLPAQALRPGLDLDQLGPEAGRLLELARQASQDPDRLTAAVEVAIAANRTFEASAVGTRLEDGRAVVLLLLLDVTARRDAERTRDRLAVHVELLAEVSQLLAATLDIEEGLRSLASLVVPALAEWVSIQVADSPGHLGLVAVHHHDQSLAPVVARVRHRQSFAASSRAPSRQVLGDGRPLLLADVRTEDLLRYVPDDELRALFQRLGVASALAVPLPGRRGILGSMVLVNGPGRRRMTEGDVAVAAEVGRRAGTAIENARLYHQQRQLAQELQRSLLTEPAQPEGLHVVARYEAATEEAQVGGDWYDAFVQPSGAPVLVIGDVVGHDTRAAAGMGQLRALVRGIGYTTSGSPAEMLERVDAAVAGLGIETTATAVVARLEPVKDEPGGVTRLRWSNAGHPPPVVLHPCGNVEVLEPSRGADLLLGVDASARRHEDEMLLPAGATVLLYTDGLVERRGRVLDEGLRQLVESLKGRGTDALDALCDNVLAQMRPDAPEDDVALVAVRLGGR